MTPSLHNTKIGTAYTDPAYRRYAPGSLLSAVGTWMQRIAQDWLVLTAAGGSAAALGTVTALQLLPMLLLGPLGGHLADRLPRRAALIWLQLASMTLAGTLAAVTVLSTPSLPFIFTIAALTGAVAGLESPLRASLLHDIAGPDRIATVVALESASGNVARLLGPALAGLLIAVMGPGPAIALNAVSYLAVMISLSSIRTHLHTTRAPGAAEASWKHVRKVLAGRPDLLVVLGLAASVAMFAFNVTLMVPVMAVDVFDKSAAGLGLLTSTMAAGSLAGAVASARRGTAVLRTVAVSSLTLGTIFAAGALAPSYLSYAVVLFVLGAVSTTMSTGTAAYLQLRVPSALRGRFLALHMMVFAGCGALSSPLLGHLTDTVGPRDATLMIGAGTVLSAAVVCVTYLTARGLTLRPHTNGWTTLPRLVVTARTA